MEIDENKLKNMTVRYTTKYEINKDVIRDFIKILIAINYVEEIPNWKSKNTTFKIVKFSVRIVEMLMRNSLCFPVIIKKTKINKKFIIGTWIFTTLKIPYPNPIYQIFPPHFGKNHIKFIENMMTVLNATGMCKHDWEALLHFSDNLPECKEKKMFKELENTAINNLYNAFLAEKYLELSIRHKNEFQIKK